MLFRLHEGTGKAVYIIGIMIRDRKAFHILNFTVNKKFNSIAEEFRQNKESHITKVQMVI